MERLVDFAKRASVGAAVCLAMAVNSPAQTLTTFLSFDGADGNGPYAALVQATDGDLYGTTSRGGTHNHGTVFQITRSGDLRVLHSFCSLTSCVDGSAPSGGLVQARNGDLYGTTAFGGARDGGEIYQITPDGTLTRFYSFCSLPDCADGENPGGGLVQAANGDLYGTTPATIFRITPGGALTTLFNFCSIPNCADGLDPSGLVQATDGNLYGTTNRGGAYYGGTVFKITPSGALTTLYNFCSLANCADGEGPLAGLVQAGNGDFYGTTNAGGTYLSGTVFKITPSGTLTTLYSFCSLPDCADGEAPLGSGALIQATNGKLYGTAQGGAGAYCSSPYGCGTVFQITPDGALTTLYSFCSLPDCADGETPFEGLVQATNGGIYGTTGSGGTYGHGTVFSLSVGLRPFVQPQTTSGAVGSTVKVLGTDLNGATSVAFNARRLPLPSSRLR